MKLAPPIVYLANILQVIRDVDHAVGGIVQVVGDDSRDLALVAQAGLSESFLQHVKVMFPDDGTPCSQALLERRRVVIRDVDADEAYVAHRAITRDQGIRAIQATPLINPHGHSLGVLTTFYRKSEHPGAASLAIIDQCAYAAMNIIEANRLEAKLAALSAIARLRISDEAVRAAAVARDVLKSLEARNFSNLLPAATRKLCHVIEELDMQAARLEA